MSKLLINESPLSVLPSLAKVIGLNEAIVLQQVQYWIANPSVGVWRDGYKWVHNSYPEWAKNFPFWSESGVKKIILRLEDMGVLLSAQFAPNPYDHTKSYRINYEELDLILGHFNLEEKALEEKRQFSENPHDSTPEVLSPHRLLTETTNTNTASTENQSSAELSDISPKFDLTKAPIEWQISAGSKELVMPDAAESKRIDAADLIASYGFGIHTKLAYDIAYAFMRVRGIIIPENKVKGQRKAVREMIEMKVLPQHVEEATKQLMDNKMTTVDLYSVAKTAIALANPAPEEYTGAIDILDDYEY